MPLAAAPPPTDIPFPKAPRQPMLWAAAAYCCGILSGTYFWRPIEWWIIAAVVFALAGVFFARNRAAGAYAIALGTFVFAGALQVEVRNAATSLDTSIQPYADGEELQITAHVIGDGRLQSAGPRESRQILEIEAEQIIRDSGPSIPLHSCIRMSIYSNISDHLAPAMRAFHYGERLQLAAKIRMPRNFRNPGAFDYRGYLADRGIAALGSAKIAAIQVLPGFSGNWMGLWRSRLHRSVVAKVHELWPAREAGLMDAMVIGEDAFIDRDTRVNFQRSGTYHILVVSGMNLGILAFVVFWLLRRLRIGELWASIATALLGFGYAYLCDWGAPIVRSALMLLFYLVTRLLYRDRAPVNAVAGAALGILILEP